MVQLFACGDIVNTKSTCSSIICEELSSLISSSDYSIANFEAPLEVIGEDILKCGPVLSQKLTTIDALKNSGFNMLLLANNHMMDFGESGLLATKASIQSAGIDSIGAGGNFDEAYSYHIKSINGLKIGIVNACEAQFGVHDFYTDSSKAGYAWINHPKIDLNIIELRKKCDFVIVFAHAGLENESIPQIEWRYRYKHLCDLGADAVIASHPHVPQGFEKHKESVIFYSLGNFYFDWSTHSAPSFSVLLQLEKNTPISFDIIYHEMKENKVVLSKNNKVDIEELNLQLQGGYCSSISKVSKKHDKRVRETLIKSMSSMPANGSLKGMCKEIVASILGKRKRFNKKLTSLHFIRNESYQNVLKCSLRIEKGNNGDN